MLRSIAPPLVCLAWALWLGGLGATFLFVTRLFIYDYALGVQAVPVLFHAFEKYQLILAALALIAAALLRIARRSRSTTLLFWMFGVSAFLAAAQPIALTPPMEALRHAGETHTPAFQRLHTEASTLYFTETLILLAAGCVIPAAIRPPSKLKT